MITTIISFVRSKWKHFLNMAVQNKEQWDDIFDDENGWNNFITKNKIADENFKEFLSTDGNTKFTLEDYQQWLIQNGKVTSTFASFTQKASVALKSFGAALGSMAINWAIGKAIDFVVTAFGDWLHSVDNAKGELEEANSKLEEVNSKLETTAARIDELNAK